MSASSDHRVLILRRHDAQWDSWLGHSDQLEYLQEVEGREEVWSSGTVEEELVAFCDTMWGQGTLHFGDWRVGKLYDDSPEAGVEVCNTEHWLPSLPPQTFHLMYTG